MWNIRIAGRSVLESEASCMSEVLFLINKSYVYDENVTGLSGVVCFNPISF